MNFIIEGLNKFAKVFISKLVEEFSQIDEDKAYQIWLETLNINDKSTTVFRIYDHLRETNTNIYDGSPI